MIGDITSMELTIEFNWSVKHSMMLCGLTRQGALMVETACIGYIRTSDSQKAKLDKWKQMI